MPREILVRIKPNQLNKLAKNLKTAAREIGLLAAGMIRDTYSEAVAEGELVPDANSEQWKKRKEKAWHDVPHFIAASPDESGVFTGMTAMNLFVEATSLDEFNVGTRAGASWHNYLTSKAPLSAVGAMKLFPKFVEGTDWHDRWRELDVGSDPILDAAKATKNYGGGVFKAWATDKGVPNANYDRVKSYFLQSWNALISAAGDIIEANANV